MKKILSVLLCLMCLVGCAAPAVELGGVAATTAPVYGFACAIAEGTDVAVTQVVTDTVSCLHDYALSVRQMEDVTRSEQILISGLGLEAFMEEALSQEKTIDLSVGVKTLDEDPHYWLDPDCAAVMAENICLALSSRYPVYAEKFRTNTDALVVKFQELKAWGKAELQDISCREIVTFHDGFSYLADGFDLEILAAVEVEAGSEPSAADLTKIVELVQRGSLPCVFTEKNGSDKAALVIAAETGCAVYALDMAMSGDWFEAMEHNINTLKEALT